MADSDSTSASVLGILASEARRLREALLSDNTRTGYYYDWRLFSRWCAAMHLPDLPATAETAGLYAVAQLLRCKVATVARRLAVVAHVHRAGGLVSPIDESVRELIRGARRLRAEQPRQVKPLTLDQIRDISVLLRRAGKAIDIRNRAILIAGFASALRSASLVALRLDDVEFTPRGIVLRIRREKQDQEGRGRLIGLPPGEHAETCPVVCLRAWLDVRGLAAGPLFWRFDPGAPGRALQPERICRIVQAAVKRIGLDSTLYGSHSIRSGFCTAAGEAGVGELLIASQTGHRDMRMLRTYFRRTDLFRSNASAMIGL